MKKTCLFLFLFSFLGVAMLPFDMPAQSAGGPDQSSLGYPTANMDVENLVSMEVVGKVALKKAKKKWGQVAPGKPIACCDQDGNLAYYMCPFAIGNGPFPSYEQIMKGVKEGRELVKDVQIGFMPEELDFSKLPKYPQAVVHSNPDVPVVKMPQAAGDSAPSYQKALKTAKAKDMGIGEYGTVYVAATYDRFPIPLVSHYLPPYYFMGDLAQERAKGSLFGNPKLSRIFFLGMRGTYFEFTSEGDSVTVHAYSLEIEPIKYIEKRALLPQEEQEIRENWDKYIKDAETE